MEIITKSQILNWVENTIQDFKQIYKTIIITLISIIFIWIVSFLAENSASTLILAGHISKWLPLAIVLFAIGWRFYELILRSFLDKKEYHNRIQSIDEIIRSPLTLVISVSISVLVFHCAVLGNLVGIQPGGGLLDNVSGVGGVLPFADAKQYYAASMSLPISGELSTYASRRPVHATVLSLFNLISGYDRINLFLLQATFVGASLGITCMAIAKWVGPAAAVLIWGMVVLLALDNTPSYMSEATGIWLGAIAIYLLITMIGRESIVLIPLSVCLFMFAFSARAGAFFILPVLVVIGLFGNSVCKIRLKKYILSLTILLIIGLFYPFFTYALFKTNGTSFQGNLSYLLYEFAVDGKDFRQIEWDYPREFKSLRENERTSFVYKKAWNAFKDSPATFPRSYIERLGRAISNFPINHIKHGSYNFIHKDLVEKVNLETEKLIALIIYSGGFLILLFGNVLTRNQKLCISAIYIGYVLSMPFVQVTENMRFHAVTWILSSGLFGSYLARKVSITQTPVESKTCSISYGLLAIIFVYYSGIVSFGSSIFDKRDELPWPDQEVNKNEGVTHYLFLGPNTPYLKLVNSAGNAVRPLIHIDEFYNTARMSRPDQREIIGDLTVGSSIFIGFDPRTNRDTIYVSDYISCMPDNNGLFIATSTWITRPYSMKIEKLSRLKSNGSEVVDFNDIDCE